jgi:DNA-binding NarL/FixJ family response regulator
MPTTDPQTILIVDDHPLFRKGVIQLIQPRQNSASSARRRAAGRASSSRAGSSPT